MTQIIHATQEQMENWFPDPYLKGKTLSIAAELEERGDILAADILREVLRRWVKK